MLVHKAFSKRALLLASAMAVVIPAYGWAADVTVTSGQTVGQVVFGGSDQITVNAGGAISTSGQAALVWATDSTGAAILNAGTIQATSGVVPAISGSQAGTLSITNSGVISSAQGTGIGMTGATGAITLTNSGTISGGDGVAVGFGSGNDVLNLQTGSLISGLVHGGAGTNTANYSGTSATQTNTQLGANLDSFETLNVNAGYWTQRSAVVANTVNIASGATLHLDGQAGATGSVSGNINNNGALTFDRSTASTYGGVISGTGTLTKSGAPTLTLSGANTYTGATFVNAGSLAITGSLASSSISLAGSGNGVSFNSNANTAYAGVISGAGFLGKLGTGTLTLSGANTYTGSSTVQAGKINLTGASSSTIVVWQGAGLDIASTGSTNNGVYDRPSAGGGVTINNAGVISAPIITADPTRATVQLTGTGALASTLTNSGTINSLNGRAITMGGGDDTLNLATGSVINGVTDLGGGTDTINLAGTIGTKTGQQTVTDFIRNGEILNVNSGYWTFNKAVDATSLTVASGATLELDGTGGKDGYIEGLSTVPVINGRLVVNGEAFPRPAGVYDSAFSLSGSGTFDIQGGARVHLGDTALTGLTTVTNGELLVTGALAGGVSVASGSTLHIGANLSAPDVDGYQTLSAGGGATGSIAGNIANNGNIIFDRSNDYAHGGVISGTGTLTKLNTGSLTLSGANTYTGATTVNQGSLVITGSLASSGISLSNSSQLYFRSDVNGEYAGVISGDGSLLKQGAGILTLSGANTYTRATVVSGAGGLKISGSLSGSAVGVFSGGSVEVTSTGSVHNGISSSTGASGITITNGGLIESPILPGNPTMATIALLQAGSAGNTINNSGTINSLNGRAITMGGGDDTLNLATGSVINGVTDLGGGTDTINLAGTIGTKTGQQTVTDFIRNGEILNVNSGYWTFNKAVDATSLTVASGATLELDGTGGKDGYIEGLSTVPVINGRLVVNGEAFPRPAGVYDSAFSLSGSGTFDIQGGARVHLGDTALTGLTTVTNGELLVTGALAGGVSVASGSTLHIGANLSAPDVDGYQTLSAGGGATGSIAGNIANNGSVIFDRSNDYTSPTIISGTGSVTKLNSNTLFYNGAQTYTGATTVSGGTLSVGGSLASSGVAVGGGANLAFTSASNSTYAGAVSGAGALNKSGAGTLTLTGANTYTGATTISGGSLIVSGSLASNGVAVASGANLTFAGANNATYVGAVSGAGSLSKAGAGTATLSGANTYTGATTVSAGSLAVTGSIASNSVAVSSGANLTFGNAGALTYGGVVSGAGSLTKTGAGALTLSNANTFTGGTTVSGGSLILSSTLAGSATVNAGGTLQIGTGGTTGSLAGNLAANGTVIFNRSDDYLFAGAFSGNGSLIKRGAGKLTLDGVYTFSGTTSIEGGTIKITQLDASGALVVGSGSTVDLSGSNQTVGGLAGGAGSSVNINGSTLTINQPSSGTPTVFGGSLTGTGSLVITGGGITDLAGTNTYTGPTSVNGGTLKVNGSITSAVTVNSGGTLGGSGTITGGVTIGSGGTLSPGNSPGVQTIVGPLTLAAGSTTVIEVDPTLTITNDRINVTGGATIANGATLSVRPLGAITNYARVNDYTILTATGGITGTFGTNVTSNMALLTPSLTYSTNTVGLRLIRNDISFASLAQTSNQTAVAAAAEGTGPSGAAYGALIGQDAAGARTGYDALSGEFYGAATSLILDESRHHRATLLRQAGSAEAGAWASAFTGEATTEATSIAAEGRNKAFGVTGGAQGVHGDWTVGFSLGYGKSDMDVAARASQADVETLSGGLYGGTTRGPWQIRLGAELANHSVEATRAIVFPTVTQSAAAAYDGSTRQVFGEISYATSLGGAAFEPFVEVASVSSKTDAFAETGAALGLSVTAQKRDLFLTTFGARLSGTTELGGATVRPHLSVGWRHASGDIEGASTASLGGSTFTVVGAGVAEDSALIDAGLGFDLSPALKATVSYSGALSSETRDSAVKASIGLKF